MALRGGWGGEGEVELGSLMFSEESKGGAANGNPTRNPADEIEPGMPSLGAENAHGAAHASLRQHTGLVHPRVRRAPGRARPPARHARMPGLGRPSTLMASGAKEPGALTWAGLGLPPVGAPSPRTHGKPEGPTSPTRLRCRSIPSPLPATGRGQESWGYRRVALRPWTKASTTRWWAAVTSSSLRVRSAARYVKE